jgi:pimeloyl-ACP methyl ester carboxylesterase
MQKQTRIFYFSVYVMLILCCAILAQRKILAEQTTDCFVGSYQLDDGTNIDIAPSAENTLRWRKFDGTSGALHLRPDRTWASTRGWTDIDDGITATFRGCADASMTFAGKSARRLQFATHDISFTSHDTTLTGRLVMPSGNAKVPIVVLVHGSEHDSAISGYSLQRMLPAQGIGAFVYDKRGTGRSGGKYTQDYSLLADDAVAAVNAARSLAGDRFDRIGFQGGSQGGWVVPLAASRTRVDFAIVCFGLAVNAIDEDQESVELQLSEKGYSHAEIRHALEVARAAENVIASDFSSGFAELDRLRTRYVGESWYKDLRGDYTYMLLPKTETELRAMAPEFDWHTPWHYDPMPVLRSSSTPQLWILGGEDYEAPSQETRRRLTSLIKEGRNYSIAFYKHAEHGMTYFDVSAAGERLSTRYAPGYFELIRDFAVHGAISGHYGDAELTLPRSITPDAKSK